jgi:hypothetical protein
LSTSDVFIISWTISRRFASRAMAPDSRTLHGTS